MAWTPTINQINCRAIADNLLAYFQTNQAAALTWAGGTVMRPFQAISSSVANRSVPIFPALQFLSDNDAVDYTGDVLIAAYSLTFEVMIQNSSPDQAVTDAKIYAKAVVSMILNCPDAIAAANTGGNVNTLTIHNIESGFDPMKTNKQQNDFLQVFQIRTQYTISGPAL